MTHIYLSVMYVPGSTGGNGGGVALLYKFTMKVTVVTPHQKHRWRR